MTDATAPSAPAFSRARIAAPILAASAAGLLALYAPEIGHAVTAFFNPCETAVAQKGGLSDLISPTSGLNTVQPFYLHAANPAEQDRAVRCLTDALYYEAANEPQEGQRAIAQVVVNRVRDRHFPKSVCGVVYEGWERHTGCQFSFACDGSIRRRPADPVVWHRLRPLAVDALNGHLEPEVGTSTHYYATYVHPNWTRTVSQVTEIGKHVFCSWKGKAGLPSALAGVYGGGEFQVADAALDGARKVEVKAPREAKARAHGVAGLRLAKLTVRYGRRHDRYV